MRAAVIILSLVLAACGARSDAPERSERPASRAAGGAAGSVCGVPGIKGEVIARITHANGVCGVARPVRVTSVSGVTLAMQPTINCTTAKALNSWVKRTAIPKVGKTGGGLKSLRVVAHYACRTRNSRKGAKISEHGKGNAVDIGALRLKDGTVITVLKGWNGKHGKLLRKLHKGACGPFGTVLGPESDRFHKDHFHFDTARYRSGSYCR